MFAGSAIITDTGKLFLVDGDKAVEYDSVEALATAIQDILYNESGLFIYDDERIIDATPLKITEENIAKRRLIRIPYAALRAPALIKPVWQIDAKLKKLLSGLSTPPRNAIAGLLKDASLRMED